MIDCKKKLYIYLWLICLFCIIFWLIQIIGDGKYFVSVFVSDYRDTFMDHFHSINNAKYDPYEDMFSNYPAMACLIFKLFYGMIPLDCREGNGFDLRVIQYGMLPFIVYTFLLLSSVITIINEKLVIDNKGKKLFSFIVVLCAPTMFAIERGNIILLSFVLTLFFVYFYENNNKILREFSFIALAIAAAIKIYPAIFGLLLLKKKKIKECIRLILYGIIFFLLPFFFYDGLESLKIMIEALLYSSNMTSDWGYGINISLHNIIETIGIVLNIEINESIIYSISLMLIFWGFFGVKKRWQELLCLTLLLLFIPKTNYYYAMIFVLIPFTELLNESNKMEYKFGLVENVTFIIFAILMIPWASNLIPQFAEDRLPVSYTMLVYYLALCWLSVVIMCEEIKLLFRKDSIKVQRILFITMGIFTITTIVMAGIG